jgi:hypothetical protein
MDSKDKIIGELCVQIDQQLTVIEELVKALSMAGNTIDIKSMREAFFGILNLNGQRGAHSLLSVQECDENATELRLMVQDVINLYNERYPDD